MELFQDYLQPRAQEHDQQVHQWQTRTKEQVVDPSCSICNIVRTKPKIDFWNFWRWYKMTTGAEIYTQNTIQVFYKKEITQELNSMEEITQKVVDLIETMRYHPRNGIEMKIEDLVRKVTLIMIQSDYFAEEVEDEELDEISNEDAMSITSTISSIAQNEDGAEQSKEFIKFWEMLKETEPKLRSFNENAVEVFEELIKMDEEEFQQLKESGERQQEIVNKLRKLIHGLKFKGLRPAGRKLVGKIMELTIFSKKFSLTKEETKERIVWNDNKDKQENTPNITPFERFWNWYGDFVHEAISYGKETEEVFARLTQLEFSETWKKEVDECFRKLIDSIAYDSENKDLQYEYIISEMVLMLEASEKFTLREEKTWRN